MSTAENSVREFNMAKRRERILAEARRMISRGGIEALNLRTLAGVADVTVPTIYNLIGNKEALVIALLTDAREEIDRRVGNTSRATPLAMTEAFVTQSIGLFAEDEQYFRAAFIALEHLDQSGSHHETAATLFEWARRMISEGLDACLGAGLVAGGIPADRLSDQVLRGYRTVCRAWAFGQCSIDDFRTTALTDVYTCLAADAVETFHAQLINRIAALGEAAGSSGKRHDRDEGATP